MGYDLSNLFYPSKFGFDCGDYFLYLLKTKLVKPSCENFTQQVIIKGKDERKKIDEVNDGYGTI